MSADIAASRNKRLNILSVQGECKIDTLARIFLVAAIVGAAVAHAANPVGHVQAAEVDEHVDDIRVNINDERTVNVVAVFSRLDPDDTVRTLLISDGLSLKDTLSRSRGEPEDRLQLIRTDGKTVRILNSTGSSGDLAQTTAWNFSVCGERVILIWGGTNTGRCADLPPLAKPDFHSAQCNDCDGPYEGMPAAITSKSRIAPLSEPGEPLTITGRVVGADGHPRAGIIVYAYHTNRAGIYPHPMPPRSAQSDFHGQLRGWARTGADGRYVFETIRPGSYPHSHNPQHVHMHVVEPGCGTYRIKELQFSDDPMRKEFTEEDRRHQEDAAIETPRKTAAGWEVTHDIILGDLPGYRSCSPGQ